AIVKSALAQAVKWEILARNPAGVVKGPKVGRATTKTYDLAVLCGLRRGEIAALRWGHVDLDTGQLAVVQSAQQTKAGGRFKEPKSGRGRTVALSATIMAELKAHRVLQARELLKVGWRLADDDFVVAQRDGSPLLPHSIGQEWVRFLERANLPRIRFHDL